ncbi:MAG: class A beta-lactamase [Caulobacteraceae bacterium]
MQLDRRLALVSLAGAALAACQPKRPANASGPATLDTARLSGEFPAIAARARPGVLGFGVALLSPAIAWVSDATARFPLQSVFKVFLAATALAEVDAGRMKLGEPILVTRQNLTPWAGAITRASLGRGGALALPAVDLMALAVQRSDNAAADALMKRVGGPPAVTAWLHGKSLAGISVDRYETEVQPELNGMGPFQPAWIDRRAWEAARDAVPAEAREAATVRYLADPRDTATLPASLDFLTRLAQGQLLSATSTRLLLRLMTDSVTGAHRLKAGLPSDASLAHKTGSSGTDLGLTPATNDIGLVTLVNGRRFALAAYLAGSTATEAARDSLIADAARLAVGCVS